MALGLWQRGWRNIIYYAHTFEKGNRPGFEREDSLRQTWLSLTGKTSAFRSVTLDAHDRNSLRALVASWKSAPKRTVLVTVNEETAYPLYGPLSDAGISLPAELGLASFGALKMAEYFRPRLTLVEPDHAEIAGESAETLFQMIAGKFPAKSPRLFPCRIAWRESTGDVLAPSDEGPGTRESRIK